MRIVRYIITIVVQSNY